jgi:membrane protease YdiL (CAAX protease family)
MLHGLSARSIGMREGRIDPKRAVLLAVVLPVIALLVGSIVARQAAASAGVSVDSFAGMVLATVGYQGMGIGVVAFFYYRWRGNPIEHLGLAVPGRRELGWAGGGLAVLVGVWLGTNALTQHFGVPVAEHQLGALSEPSQILVFIALSFLIVAPGEELLYRGLVQGTLREAYGAWPSIAAASALFALNHVGALVTTDASAGTATAVTIGLVLVLSILLGYLYERTETLVVPILVHAGFNGLQFGLRYVEVTGTLS